MTLAGHELAWGPGAEPPEIQGFWQSIMKRRVYQREAIDKLNQTNSLLHKIAKDNEWNFINNANIDPSKHLNVDGVHLNAGGASVLAQNLAQHINGITTTEIAELLNSDNPRVSTLHPTSSNTTTIPQHYYEDVAEVRSTLPSNERMRPWIPPMPNIPRPLDRDIRSTEPWQQYHEYIGCYFCGERNHKKQSCRYGQEIECYNCHNLGHKAKFCTWNNNN